ncbi:hypothetical protein [Brevundimonas bullata]
MFVVLATSILTACATEGRIYNREASDAFRLGTTSADEAIQALGQPDLDFIRPIDNVRIMRWTYRRQRFLSVDEHVLSANFGPNGKLVYLHNPAEGQRIDPF